MKIIKPSVQFFGAVPTDYDGAIRFIEMAGRTCYKSEDKITPDSAEKFVRKLISAGHLAMVEHSNFVIHNTLEVENLYEIKCRVGKYLNIFYKKNKYFIGGSLTAWYQAAEKVNWGSAIFDPFRDIYGNLFKVSENICTERLWKICPHDEIPLSLHRYSAKFICDRGISHELVRHRPCSFAQESTRYVNYGKKNMEFIEPIGYEDWHFDAKFNFQFQCEESEYRYNNLLRYLTPQQARAVLPNALKTEIIVTADAAEWTHIKRLRTAAASHPDMQRIMNMMPWEEFLC